MNLKRMLYVVALVALSLGLVSCERTKIGESLPTPVVSPTKKLTLPAQ